MKNLELEELNVAAVVALALSQALFDEFDETAKERVIERAVGYLPPKPDDDQAPPAEKKLWMKARARLKSMGTD